MKTFTKQPSERRWVRVDFTDGLANLVTPSSPDIIDTYTITAAEEVGGTTVTATVVGAGYTAVSPYVYFLAQDGTTGINYIFTIKVVTSSGQKCEQEIRVKVKEKP